MSAAAAAREAGFVARIEDGVINPKMQRKDKAMVELS